MKKKIFSLYLVVMLLLFCCGCQRLSAGVIMMRSGAKMAALNSSEIQGTVRFKMAASGLTIDIPINFNLKKSGLSSENPVSLMTMDLSFMNKDFEVTSYEEGEYQYSVTSVAGQKMRLKQKRDISDLAVDSLWNFSEEDLVDVSVTYNKDATKTVVFTLAGEKVGEIFDISALGIVAEAAAADTELHCTVGTNGYMQKITLAPQFSGESDGVSTTYTLDIVMEFVNPGEAVTVTPPEGYKDFPETELSGGLFT